MHLLSLFLLPIIATAVSAGSTAAGNSSSLHKRDCYSGGASWGPRQAYADRVARILCNSHLGERVYTDSESTRTACVDIGDNLRAEFEIRKRPSGNWWLSHDWCYDGLQKEINACGNCGSSEYSEWFFRYAESLLEQVERLLTYLNSSDPNDGLC